MKIRFLEISFPRTTVVARCALQNIDCDDKQSLVQEFQTQIHSVGLLIGFECLKSKILTFNLHVQVDRFRQQAEYVNRYKSINKLREELKGLFDIGIFGRDPFGVPMEKFGDAPSRRSSTTR